MKPPRPQLIVSGQVLIDARVAARDVSLTAEAVGIAGGRVCAVGRREEIAAAAVPGAPHVEAGELAVVPGLHDSHLHLVGMARARREVRLDEVAGADLVERVRAAAERVSPPDWLRGRGWHDMALPPSVATSLADAVEGRPALIYSHDGHSAWASPAALAAAGIGSESADPPGGRIERDAGGRPTGVLRERAADAVEAVAGRLRGPDLEDALDEVLAGLAAWGLTGATDAGDASAGNGSGEFAALGDRASLLLAARARLDGRIRLRVGLPAQAIAAARARGLRSLGRVPGCETVRIGWAKVYADGTLGSRTASLFAPYTCGDQTDAGILRVPPEELEVMARDGRQAGIALAVHAIGDRAAAAALDALERAPARRPDQPPDRLEHLQLMRPADRQRLATLDVTASVQPVHCPADRALMERCWSDRLPLAYPWRSLREAGARLAFGSDAPIETANPWLGLHAAIHRRLPGEPGPDWYPAEALDVSTALAAYTGAAASSARRPDEGHLRLGAVADLAVLNVDLATVLAADERLAEVRSSMTLLGGREVHRS